MSLLFPLLILTPALLVRLAGGRTAPGSAPARPGSARGGGAAVPSPSPRAAAERQRRGPKGRDANPLDRGAVPPKPKKVKRAKGKKKQPDPLLDLLNAASPPAPGKAPKPKRAKAPRPARAAKQRPVRAEAPKPRPKAVDAPPDIKVVDPHFPRTQQGAAQELLDHVRKTDIFDPNHIADLQRVMGSLDPDGVVGKQTRFVAEQILKRSLAWPGGMPTSAPPPDLSGLTVQDAAEEFWNYAHTYKGKRAERVAAYQKRLGLAPDGKVGPLTKAKVKQLTGKDW